MIQPGTLPDVKLMRFTHIKPNPAGKDKAGETPKPIQLLAEWLVIQNTGLETIEQSHLAVAHTEFDTNGRPKKEPKIYWYGQTGTYLAPGESLRIHAGKSSDSKLMLNEDREGVTKHAFSEKNEFVLNNKEGDKVYLYQFVNKEWKLIDAASYDQNPPEGEILFRQGDKFLALAPAKPWTTKHQIGSSGKAA